MDEKMFDAVARGIGNARDVRRRTVLGGAGAAFALLLSGILSSVGVDEAEAHNGDGGGRRKNKKKNRKKNKDQQPPVTSPPPGDSDDLPGLGSDSWIYVRMIVENLTNADIDFEGIALYEETRGKICRTKDLRTIHPTEAITFAPGDSNGFPLAGITSLLNDKYSVEAAQEQGPNHDFPVVWASSTLYDTNIEGCKTGSNVVISNRKMGVGQKLSFTMEGQKFELLRENDVDNARSFRLRVLAA